MKTIDPKRCWVLGAALAAALGLALGACDSDDDSGGVTDTGTSTPLTVESIIATPKSADPGDTLLLSAIVTASTPNEGDIPTMAWTATGGAFLEDNQASVRWIAPTAGVYRVTARATNTVSTATGHADVFVGGVATVVINQAGAVTLQANGSDIFFLRTANNITLGAEVFSVTGGVATDAIDLPTSLDGAIGDFIAYAPDRAFEVHSIDTVGTGAQTPAVHLYLGDFATKDCRRISEEGQASGFRYPGFTGPDVAPDSRYIAYTGMFPTPLAAGADSFDIMVYDNVGSIRRRVTLSHNNHRNSFPTWSTDQRWLTFVSDRSGRNQWDLYGMKVTGGIVDEDQSDLVRLSNTGGVLVDGNPGGATFVKPMMAWNPVSPTLAVVASDGVMYLIATTLTGASQITVEGGSPSDIAWSPDGSTLAIAEGPALYTATTTGDTTLVIRRTGDSFADVAWSPDGGTIVYRVTRGTSCWFEAVQAGSAPLPITAAEPLGRGALSLGLYRTVMSTKPVWGNNGLLYYPSFATGAVTIGIVSVDVSGLSP